MHLALAPIVAQLVGAGVSPVEGLLELKTLTAPPARMPAHYVVPLSEAPSANKLAGARDQRVAVTFAVIVVLAGARRKETINDELKAETDAVKNALTGWTHPEASAPCDYAGGGLMSASGSTVEWQVRFTTWYHLRKPT